MRRYRLHIVGEVSIEVRHCLLALPGVAAGDLRRVMSHPQALSQCDGYLRRMRGVAREAVLDTAGAAQDIARHGWRRAPALWPRARPRPLAGARPPVRDRRPGAMKAGGGTAQQAVAIHAAGDGRELSCILIQMTAWPVISAG